jgi:hypothetical protein
MIRILTAILAASAIMAAASSASAENLQFEFENTTSAAVTEFYASPVGVKDWEDNLASSPLPAGASATASISDARDVCAYDIHVVFDDGTDITDEAVDLCETGSYTVHE